MDNVTYYPFLQFFPENFELTEFQFPVAIGLVIRTKEKDLLHERPNSVWTYQIRSLKQKMLTGKPMVLLKLALEFLKR